MDDFGTQGAKPTHPELLDYLTSAFEEHNWDLKWLSKEIMMSQAYRQSSAEVPEYVAADPSNKLLWRKAQVRLEAETIRDSMLKVSGLRMTRCSKQAHQAVPMANGSKITWVRARSAAAVRHGAHAIGGV
jgi:hypothetical protein